MTVRVSAVEPRRFQWIGTVGSTWVFEGQHTFDVHSLADGRNRVVDRDRVSRLLVPFVLSEDPQRDYDRMNRALTQRVERRT